MKILFVTIGAAAAGVLSFFGVPIAVLVLAIAYIHFWQVEASSFEPQLLVILTALTLLAVFLDNIVLFIGLKRSNASKRAYIGAVCGALVGALSANLVGIFIFSMVGAIAGELLHGKNQKDAFKSGFGAAISLLLGSALRAVLTATLTIAVLWQLF